MILEKIAKAIVKISGWKIVGELPSLDKAVYIAAPHTSNWDGFWFLVGKAALGLEAHFLAKHTLFWWPLGNLLRWFGAIPIDRSHGAEVVPQLIETINKSDRFCLALAPEGTRKWMPYWKTGFYRIAVEADVPIVLAFIDYKAKKWGLAKYSNPAATPTRTWNTCALSMRRLPPAAPRTGGR